MLPRSLTRPALVAAAAALLVAVTGCSTLAAGATPTTTAAPRASTVQAVAIGDSIAIGNGVPSEDAWPLLVADQFGWTLTDLADSASGFLAPGLNTHTYDAQVSAAIRLHPDVVVIAATRNDTLGSTTVLTSTATEELARLRTALPDATIIGVGPIWGAGVPSPQTPVVAGIVRTAVLSVGGHWVDVGQPFQGRLDLVQKDDIHPTADGQKLLAGLIADKLASAHLAVRASST